MRRPIERAASFIIAALVTALATESGRAQEPVPPHATFTLQSAVLGETRRINVYTPPGYATAEYPVLYMPDGGVHEDFPHVAAAVDAAIREGAMRRMIVVGIENTERRRDMTPPTDVEEDRRIAPRVGGSAAFRRFIRQELMPEVRRRYRATDETGIIGESLAGLFIVETFFAEPELFDTYIALSPSLWWNAEELVRNADARLKSPPPARPAFRSLPTVLYLSSADEENIAPAAARLAEALRANASDRYRWQYRPRPELTHATLYRAEAPRVLRDLFPPVYSSIMLQGTPDASPVTPHASYTRVTRERAGIFEILHEAYRAEQPYDGYDPWNKVHLSFTSADGRVNVALTDNGSGLSATAQTPGCQLTLRHLQYGGGDERRLFGMMLTALRALADGCRDAPVELSAYTRLLEQAEPDFAAAMRVMKARVAATFGARTERCNPPDPEELPHWVMSSHPYDPCGP